MEQLQGQGDAPCEQGLGAPEQERQLASFNVTTAFDEARSRRFLAALDLHRVILSENYEGLRPSLVLCNKMIEGDPNTLKMLDKAMQRRLWDLLFLCCPVVSSSLASMARMFSAFGAGQIPWLLIDEAGQATPASGARGPLARQAGRCGWRPAASHAGGHF